MTIYGSDHSHYDWAMYDDVKKVYTHFPLDYSKSKSVFMLMKACDGTRDTPFYAEEISRARAAGKLAAPYVWLYPRTHTDPKAQADFWYTRLKSEPLIVIDFEAYASFYPDYDDLYNAIERMRANGYVGKIMIYTGHWYWLAHGSTSDYWLQFPVWLARYYTEPPQPTAPWNDWDIWQYSASGAPSDYGITNGKLAVDENRFEGTIDELAALFGSPVTPPPPQEVNMNKVTILASTINVRSGDNTTFPIVRQLKLNNICYTPFDAKPNAGGKVWVQITEIPAEFVAVGDLLSKVEALPGGGNVYPEIKFAISANEGYAPVEVVWKPQ